ncbi:MAG: HIT family protein [Bacilli bacterium]|nr:HIT family protein [Bacilli bacterium]
MDCIFCKIVNGEIPSFTLYEDDLVKAFLDVNPLSNGHTLIVPKKHYTDLMDIPDDLFIHIISVARKISSLLTENLGAEGITLIQNNGLPQEVKHFHLHLKPAYSSNQELVNPEDVYNQIKDIM